MMRKLGAWPVVIVGLGAGVGVAFVGYKSLDFGATRSWDDFLFPITLGLGTIALFWWLASRVSLIGNDLAVWHPREGSLRPTWTAA